MPKFLIQETTQSGREAKTVRFGAGSGAANNWTQAEVGKAVKLSAESRYDLCSVGDNIEGYVSSVDNATQDGFTTGGLVDRGYKSVTFDGSQAAGTGAIAVGDFVVAGTVPAKGTAIAAGEFMRVRKATVQIGTDPGTTAAAGTMAKAAMFAWRVVSLGQVGTGAVGTNGVIERVAV